jgi:hypothetical protein
MAKRAYTLRDIPDDVFKIVQKEQSEIKQKRRINIWSFESTIYKMLKDYDRCRKETTTFKPEPI